MTIPAPFPFNTGLFNKIRNQTRYFRHQAESLVPNRRLSAAVTRRGKEAASDVTFLFLPWKRRNKETFQAELCRVALLPAAQVRLICDAFAEARRDGVPGEAARVETIDVVIAGGLNETLL